MGSEYIQKRALWVVIGLWAITILPSVLFPYWAFMDDPGVLYQGSLGLSYPYNYLPNPHNGRYCPAYHLYYSLIYLFAGYSLPAYYLMQSLIILGVLLIIFNLAYRLSGTRWAGLSASILFLTSSPVAENAYTLGKPESRVTLLMMAAFGLFFHQLNRRNLTAIDWISWAAIPILILTAMLTKETSMVVLVFGLSGTALTLIWGREVFGHGERMIRWVCFLICAVFVIGGARILYFSLLPESAVRAYTKYPITASLIWDNFRFYLLQIPDVLLLVLCSITACLIALRQGSSTPAKQNLVFSIALCLTGLAYLSGMLLWRWPLSYYLLVPAAILSLAFSSLAFQVMPITRFRKVIWVMAGIILLSRFYTVPYGIYVARAQKSVDRTFTELMAAYADRAEPGQRLLVEDWPFFVEPVGKSNRLLTSIWHKEDLLVEGVRDLLDNEVPSPETLNLYNYDKVPDPDTRYPEIGDFVARFTGQREVPWMVRGVSPYRVASGESSFRDMGAILARLESKNYQWWGLHCSLPRPVPQLYRFSAGYQLYRVIEPPWLFWEGRWADGWIGKEAFCRIRMKEPAVPLVLSGTAPPAVIPSTMQIFHEGVSLGNHMLDEPGAFSIPIILERHGETDPKIRFQIDRTFVPLEMGGGRDDRRLGVILQLDQAPEVRWSGRWHDGWMGKESTTQVFWSGEGKLTVGFSGVVASAASPQVLHLSVEGRMDVLVYELPTGPFEFTATLEPAAGPPRYIPITLRAGRTFNPKAMGENEDIRDLSLRISAIRIPREAGLGKITDREPRMSGLRRAPTGAKQGSR